MIRSIGKGFVERYDPTIEDVYTKVVAVHGKDESFEIIDSAGQEDFATIREQYIQKADGFILVCSMIGTPPPAAAALPLLCHAVLSLLYYFADIDSFRDIEAIYLKQIYRTRELTPGGGFPIIVVCNKCDMADQRKVMTKDLEELAKVHQIQFFEASAKTCTNINEAFLTLATLVVEGKKKETAAEAGAGGDGKDKKKKWWKW